jgi:hypothetical protein
MEREALAQPEQEPIREVLKQVLELTESMVLHCDAELNQHDVNVIVAKGIEALAQPEQEPIVGIKTWFEDGKVITQHLTAKDIYKEPALEPSAWMYDWFCDGKLITGWIAHSEPEIPKSMALNIRPLYTAPPQRTWVGLTEDELANLSASGLSLWQLWRAIEAKLKDKNNG